MIKNKIGKWIGMCALALSVLCCTGTIAYADTTKFDITVTKTGYLGDNVSKRINKAGGAKYENCFYATPTSFSPAGSIHLKSVQVLDSSLETGWVIARKKNVTVSAKYKGKAPANVNYYMKGAYNGSDNGYSLNVVGRYTP